MYTNQEATLRHEVEVDTRIAAEWNSWQQQRVQVGRERESVHYAARHRRTYDRSQQWNHTLDEGIATLTAQGDEYLLSYGKTAAQVLAGLAAARAAAEAQRLVYQAADDEYAGWSRFFLVVGGHIHSSLHCSTCYDTTIIGWLPQLSGLTEADAVAEYGAVLCTVCYPSAPVDHVNGGTSDGLTLTERKAAKAERDTAKAERDAKKFAKTLQPELQFVELNARGKDAPRGYDFVTTVAAAKQQLRDAYKIAYGFGYQTHREHAAQVVVDAERALQAKGVSQKDIDGIKARALKQAQRDGF